MIEKPRGPGTTARGATRNAVHTANIGSALSPRCCCSVVPATGRCQHTQSSPPCIVCKSKYNLHLGKMGASRRCSALAAFVALTAVPSECQAFINCFLRTGERTPPAAATTSTTSFRHSSSGRCRKARVKDCGALLMSEVAEDYPSDTGDDRFAGGGK